MVFLITSIVTLRRTGCFDGADLRPEKDISLYVQHPEGVSSFTHTVVMSTQSLAISLPHDTRIPFQVLPAALTSHSYPGLFRAGASFWD